MSWMRKSVSSVGQAMPVAEQPGDLLDGGGDDVRAMWPCTRICSMLSLRTRCPAAGQPLDQRSAPAARCRSAARARPRTTSAMPPPLMRYLTVVQGASRMSSWSAPSRLAPFSLNTPMTLNGTFCTRISSPIG